MGDMIEVVEVRDYAFGRFVVVLNVNGTIRALHIQGINENDAIRLAKIAIEEGW